MTKVLYTVINIGSFIPLLLELVTAVCVWERKDKIKHLKMPLRSVPSKWMICYNSHRCSIHYLLAAVDFPVACNPSYH